MDAPRLEPCVRFTATASSSPQAENAMKSLRLLSRYGAAGLLALLAACSGDASTDHSAAPGSDATTAPVDPTPFLASVGATVAS